MDMSAHRQRWGLLLKAGISAALLVLLYRRVDLPALRTQLGALSWPPLALFFALLFGNSLLSALKWRGFLAADGPAPPRRALLGAYLIGSFLSVFLPSTIGGDAYRLYDLTRRGIPGGRAAASIFADRFTGFLALAALGAVLPPLGLRRALPLPALAAPLAAGAALWLLAWTLYRPQILRRLLAWTRLDRSARLNRFADRFLASVAVYRDRPGLLLRSLALSLLFQFGVIGAVYCVARALRLPASFLFFCGAVPLVSLLEALPLSIYGLGLRDGAYWFFLARIGRPAAEAAALSLLYVAATLVYVSLGGVLFALRRTPEPTPS
mgnify:CR=1 FL=1